MRSPMTILFLLVALIVLGVGCAPSEEWQDWRTSSLRNNKDGSNPRESRTGVAAAQTENWWGKVITVSPEQIFESR
jgi:hypothetical protein